MKAVLLTHQEQLLTPLQQTLTTEAPFRETLDHLVTIVTVGND